MTKYIKYWFWDPSSVTVVGEVRDKLTVELLYSTLAFDHLFPNQPLSSSSSLR
ncbi:hypothetical protein U9R62_06905 [Cylindrospermopsis raciborskii DSH]|uniref:hypothetical protein n=1 Tax=Cylindrospermopsis raciborskii TaxID=77022 RepID=UPI002ED8E470